MKQYYAMLLFILGCWMQTQAQVIRVDSSIFPRPGAVLRISQALDTPLVITPSGNQPQFWDFSMLRTASYSEDSILSAATAPSASRFPTATVVQPLLGGAFGTAYVEVSNTAVSRIGGGIELFVISLVEPYANPQTLQVAPLSYLTSFNDSYQLNFGLAIDSIPALRTLLNTLLSGAPLPGGASPDSLRLKFSGQRRARVDALGQCLLPDSVQYDVVRQQVTEYNNWAIEARVSLPFVGGLWVDVSNFLGGSLPIPIAQNDTTIYYDFLASGHIEPLVRLNMDNSNSVVESAQFKGRRAPDPTALGQVAPTFQLRYYPNPSQGQLRVEGPAQIWTLSIHDLVGRQVFFSSPQIGTADFDLQHLGQGWFVIQILGEDGLPLAGSKRLLVK